jgi:hypothetical protein
MLIHMLILPQLLWPFPLPICSLPIIACSQAGKSLFKKRFLDLPKSLKLCLQFACSLGLFLPFYLIQCFLGLPHCSVSLFISCCHLPLFFSILLGYLLVS